MSDPFLFYFFCWWFFFVCFCFCLLSFCSLVWISRAPNQNDVSQAWYIVEIHHSGQELLIYRHLDQIKLLFFSWTASLCLSVCPSILDGKNFHFWPDIRTFQTLSCTFHVYRHPWPLPFHKTFSDFDLCWGSQGMHKTKHSWFIFCKLLNWSGQSMRWCWSDLSWTPGYFFRVRVMQSRKIRAVLLMVSNNFKVGLHLNVYAPNCFKLGETLSQCQRFMRKKLLHQSPHKVFGQFEWDVVCCWHMSALQISLLFDLIPSIFKQENCTWMTSLKKQKQQRNQTKLWHCFWHLLTISFWTLKKKEKR